MYGSNGTVLYSIGYNIERVQIAEEMLKLLLGVVQLPR